MADDKAPNARPTRETAKHSKKDPAKPTRAKAAREQLPPIAPALEQLFFFSSGRRHTRFDCDWSSDVCSSDLRKEEVEERNQADSAAYQSEKNIAELEIGRASCRERVQSSARPVSRIANETQHVAATIAADETSRADPRPERPTVTCIRSPRHY